jgi:hypothetical protein
MFVCKGFKSLWLLATALGPVTSLKKLKKKLLYGAKKKKPIVRHWKATTLNHRFVLPKPIGTAL